MSRCHSKSFFSGSSRLHYSGVFLFLVGFVSLSVLHAQGLKDAAAKAYMHIGTATDRPSNYTDIIKKEFDILVCENAMKFSSTEPSKGNFTFNGGDNVLSFATTNNMKMRGHCLLWHTQVSNWIQNLDRAQTLAGMKEHIEGVLTHYKGKILEWDVVNEAVADGGNSLRSSFWTKNVGNDFIDSAFVYARKADPSALLYYNDYGTEGMGTKANYVYNMVKGMKERVIPIDGVGLQCHFTNSVNKADVSANIKRLGALGLRVSCTEIDIQNTSTNGTPWKSLMEACLENFNTTAFVVWGVSDAASWRGSNCGCLIWDGQNKVKPAVYDALTAALNNADPAITAKRKAFIEQGTKIRDERMMKVQSDKGLQFSINNDELSYTLPVAQEVHVQLITILGKVAVELNPGMQQPGSQRVQLTRRNLPAGFYIVKIQTGGKVQCIPFTKLDNVVMNN